MQTALTLNTFVRTGVSRAIYLIDAIGSLSRSRVQEEVRAVSHLNASAISLFYLWGKIIERLQEETKIRVMRRDGDHQIVS